MTRSEFMNHKYTKQFDFEIGYLVKSPCKDCIHRVDFPECAQSCPLLAQIQIILSAAISCTGKYASLESSATSLEGWLCK